LWDRYGKIAGGVLVAVVVIVAVAFFMVRSRRAAEEAAAGRLAEANVLFWQGDYPRSLELSKQIIAQYPSAPSGIEAHRLAADNSFWAGDFKNAVAEYRRYLEKVKPGLFADAARRSLAYALESDAQYLEAAKAYEELVGKFDRNSSAEFLAGAARCYRRAGRRPDAIQRLQRLESEFGETSYARAARIDLAELTATP
jgi:tetratricopeptide (TPR) repeat protein